MSNFLNFILLFTAIIIIGGLLLAVMMLTKKGERRLDVDKYRSQWLKIEQALEKDTPSTYQLTILNADKLLGRALQERGIEGKTMGECMKTYNARWSNANAIWAAHKMRNQIAHDPDYTPSYQNARLALSVFKQALKDVGAI